MIRECTAQDFDAIFTIINDAAQAYRGVIPADCRHEPYLSREHLRHEMDAGAAYRKPWTSSIYSFRKAPIKRFTSSGFSWCTKCPSPKIFFSTFLEKAVSIPLVVSTPIQPSCAPWM